MQPQPKKLKVEVVIPTRKSDEMASASTMTSDVSMIPAAQTQNQAQPQLMQEPQQFQPQLQHVQLQQAQRAQSQQATLTPPPQTKQESVEPQRPKLPIPDGPAELRWRMNTMLSNMVPSQDAQGTGLFENVKEFTDLMAGLDREDMRKVATDCMDQAPVSTIRAMASAGSAGKLFSGKVQTWLAKLINKEEDFKDEFASAILRVSKSSHHIIRKSQKAFHPNVLLNYRFFIIWTFPILDWKR
jgi:hypothetical protein